MTSRTKNKRRKEDIYEKYRRILEMSHLTDEEIGKMRKHVGLLAQTICEHVWEKEALLDYVR